MPGLHSAGAILKAMLSPWPVNDLEIVGYANVLNARMLPSVVPPMFRLRAEPQRILLPPYAFNGGYLCNAAEVPAAELKALADAGEVTLFHEPIAAQADWELWVDESFQQRYEPQDEARTHLDHIAETSRAEAIALFKQGNFAEADRLASVAISANDRKVDALVIKAAIRRAGGDTNGELLMEDLALPIVDRARFLQMVETLATTTPMVEKISLRRHL